MFELHKQNCMDLFLRLSYVAFVGILNGYGNMNTSAECDTCTNLSINGYFRRASVADLNVPEVQVSN